MTFDAERSIAGYDSDETRVLAAIEKSLAQFPDCGNLILGKLSCLRELTRQEERLEILANMCAIDSHPVFLQYYAQEIGDDGRSAELAIALLRRTIRQMPSSAQNYYSLAQILWVQREYDLAFELYRFAACLEEKKSHYAKTYFFTARHRNGGFLGFADCHVAWFSNQELTTPSNPLVSDYNYPGRVVWDPFGPEN